MLIRISSLFLFLLLGLSGQENPVSASSPLLISSGATTPAFFLVMGGREVRADMLELGFGLKVTNVTGIPNITPQTVDITNMKGDFYGGKIQGDVSYDDVKKLATLTVSVKGAKLELFLVEVLRISTPFQGKVDGQMKFVFADNSRDPVQAKGSFRVYDGTLVAAPLLVDLLLGDPTASGGRDEGSCEVEISKRRFHFTQIQAKGPSLSVAGEGTIGFDGSMNVAFQPKANPVWMRPIPGVSDVLLFVVNSVVKNVGKFRVIGSMGNVQITSDVFGR
jgi:hypothetical protein